MSAPRALITGISGQDGSYLAELLLEKGYEVFGIVRGSPRGRHPNLTAIKDDITLLQGDLLDQMTLLDAISRAEPDELYNLAATSFVPSSWRQPVLTAQFTAVGTTAILEAIRITKPGLRYFQASSSEIFGATTESPQNEDTPFRPHNPYGIAKLYAHLMVATYRARYGLHTSSGILYNHESPRRPAEFVTRKITRGAAAIKLGLASELRLGNLDAQRDWSFAGDVVEAIWLMLQQSTGGDYVVASGVGHSVRELTRVAFGHVELEPDEYVVVDPEFVRPLDPITLVGNATRAHEQLGWQPRTSFEDMIGMMVEQDLADLRAERAAPSPLA
ncbi:MAG: GDPmannose 4,6-dehydratase [Solirubrobacteraceae bacterium]|nr:GDPmannose 4,6-dehydratase [Solirubrobacteraceae bacterium]